MQIVKMMLEPTSYEGAAYKPRDFCQWNTLLFKAWRDCIKIKYKNAISRSRYPPTN